MLIGHLGVAGHLVQIPAAQKRDLGQERVKEETSVTLVAKAHHRRQTIALQVFILIQHTISHTKLHLAPLQILHVLNLGHGHRGLHAPKRAAVD